MHAATNSHRSRLIERGMIHCQRCGRPILDQERDFDGQPDVYCDYCQHVTYTTDAPGLIGGTVRHG